MKNIYEDPSVAAKYNKSFAIPEKALGSICRGIVDCLPTTEAIDLLFVGSGSGRLELPFLKSIARSGKVKKIRVRAVDKSASMLALLERNAASIFGPFEGSSFSLAPSPEVGAEIHFDYLCADLMTEAGLESVIGRYDLITAFFSLHVMRDWLTPLSQLLATLKLNGQFIYAEETGDTKWIDNRFDNYRRIKAALSDETLRTAFSFWQLFHECRRTVLGKEWDQDLIASDAGSLGDMLADLGWPKLSEFETVWEPDVRYRFSDYWSWVKGNSLYNPVSADLSSVERDVIAQEMKKAPLWSEIQKKFELEIPRQEGHRIHVWAKPDVAGPTRKDLERVYLKTFFRGRSEHFLRRAMLLRMPAEDIKDLSGRKKDIYRRIIRNRAYMLYKFLFRTKQSIQIDYTVWEPTDTSLEGDYLDNLDIILRLPSEEGLVKYLASYTVYTNVRPSADMFFMNIVFREQNLLNKIVIRRSSQPSCDISLLPDGSVSRVDVGVPPVLGKLLDDTTWDEVVTGLHPYIRDAVAGRELFYNFNQIHTPYPAEVGGAFKNQFEKIREALLGLETSKEYRDLKAEFNSEVENKIWDADARASILEGTVVEVFIKSIFYLELLGHGTEDKWNKISFLPGLFIRTRNNYKGFTCPIVIEKEASEADYASLLEPFIWNFSQQDGLIEYAGLAAREGELKGHTAATVDFLHTIKNDIDTPRGLIDAFLEEQDYKYLLDARSSLRFIRGSASTAYIAGTGLRPYYFFAGKVYQAERRLALAFRIALEEANRFASIKTSFNGELRATLNGAPIFLGGELSPDNMQQVAPGWTEPWTGSDAALSSILKEVTGDRFSHINFNLHLDSLIGAWGEIFFNCIKHGREYSEGGARYKKVDVKVGLESDDDMNVALRFDFINYRPERGRRPVGGKARGKGVTLLTHYFRQLNRSTRFSFDSARGEDPFHCWCYIWPDNIRERI